MSEPGQAHYFEWEDAGGIAVIRFTTPYLRDYQVIVEVFGQIEKLVEAGKSKIILNFDSMQAFASYAIGKLIALDAKLQGPAGRLALCCLSPTVAEIIDIMSLRKRFKIYASEREAIESFA